MIHTTLKAAYLHSPLRRLGYSYARALAETPIRKCLEASARAAARRAQATGEATQQALL